MEKDIVDFHVHLFEFDALNADFAELIERAYPDRNEYDDLGKKYANPHAFLGLMDQNGVDYAVVMAEISPLASGISRNEKVEAFCRVSPRLIPFCSINPYQHSKMGKMLADLCLNHGFKGLKLLPPYNYFYPNDKFLYPLYAVAERLGIPVNFHTGSSIFNNRIKYGNPIYFDDVAVDFPDLKIIMAHGGRGPWYDEAMTMIRLHKNVYIDIAGLPPKKLLDFFPDMERFAHKFLFGSDWPFPAFNIVNMTAVPMVPKKNIEALKKLNISPAAKALILGENSKKLLGLGD